MKRLLALVSLALMLILTAAAAAQGSPYIVITMPASGTAIPNPQSGVSVTGTAGFLNDVITIQALDINNNVIAQTTTNNPQPEGQWAASLAVNYIGEGAIVALSGNNATGSVDATARVFVTFGTPQPVQPLPATLPPPTPPPAPTQPPQQPQSASISISSPPNGGVADVTSGTLTVTGAAFNVFENNVIVQVRDAFSRVLMQTATTANANGAWAAYFSLLIANGTQGSIRAWAQSPADGSVMAEAVANVTFTSTCTPRTDWPVYTVQPGDSLLTIANQTGSTTHELTVANCLSNPNLIIAGTTLYVPRLPAAPSTVPPALTITSPAANTVVSAGPTLLVTGTTAGAPVGNTFVRALDLTGAVLVEQIVTVTQELENEQWAWQASLNTATIPSGTRLTIYAYAVNPTDGSVLVAAIHPISFGAPFPTQPFITITSPVPYTQLNDAATGITVTGRGGNLVDVITVQAVNDAGQVMAMTTTNNPQGADGEWAVSLTVPEIRRGRIVAYSGNQATQSIEAYAALDVIFGDPTALATYVLLNTPLPQAIVTATEPYVIVAGSARGVFADRVMVNVLDDSGTILLSAPAQVNLNTGSWSLVSYANTFITLQRRLSLQVIATTPDGGVLAADRIVIETRP